MVLSLAAQPLATNATYGAAAVLSSTRLCGKHFHNLTSTWCSFPLSFIRFFNPQDRGNHTKCFKVVKTRNDGVVS